MRVAFSALLSLCLVIALVGCTPRGGNHPDTSPSVTPPTATGTPEPTAEATSVSVERMVEFNYKPEQFNDLFMQHPVQFLGGNKIAMLIPVPPASDTPDAPSTVRLEVRNGKEVILSRDLDANNWNLRCSPDRSTLSWLTWKKDAGKEFCALVSIPVEGGEQKDICAFPTDAVVTDYVWGDKLTVYAVAAFDESFTDIRLYRIELEKREPLEMLASRQFPYLSEREVLPIPPRVTYSPTAKLGYFDACGCLFAFSGENGKGGIFLDGAGLFYLTGPEISEKGDRMSFHTLASGAGFAACCEMSLADGKCFTYTDRRMGLKEFAADAVMTRHNFYMAQKYNTDIVSTGGGLVSIESDKVGQQILIKGDKDILSLAECGDSAFITITPRGYSIFRLSKLRFDAGFPSQRWYAQEVKTADKYPDFTSPESTIRTYLASFRRGDSSIWSVCRRDDVPAKWVSAVEAPVAARSLKLISWLRNYSSFTAVAGGEETISLEGTLELCGAVVGRDLFTMSKMGDMWIIETIKAAEDLK
ncbi:MAG: hypothetical protein WC712_07960 [Candidatus Brocadiia bacterium]